MPTQEWIVEWASKQHLLRSPIDFDEYFERSRLFGREMQTLPIGKLSVPSGFLLVRDPLCYLYDRKEEPYFLPVPTGEYDAELAVVKPSYMGEGALYAALRVRFSDERSVEYKEALSGSENLTDLEEESYFGFYVDAGLACIIDKKVQLLFADFAEKWHLQNPEGNLYDDYFAPLFEANAGEHPALQRETGDWLNWTLPGTEYHIPICTSGYGDGVYPVYYGFDRKGDITELIVQFVDLELAFMEAEDDHDCGCGHDHHHDHDCACGHDHHHDHECGCGHDHHHDHECGCGHDHHHE